MVLNFVEKIVKELIFKKLSLDFIILLARSVKPLDLFKFQWGLKTVYYCLHTKNLFAIRIGHLEQKTRHKQQIPHGIDNKEAIKRRGKVIL